MSEEIKINMPLFDINEEAELENELSFHLEEFTNEIMRTMSKDKDIIILKKVIEKQQAEIKKLQKEIESIEESCNTCFELQQKEKEELRDKIREIISKYINVQEHFKYTNQELYGKELRNMIKELLEV